MTVLVTYASKHGSTQGIAEAIGDRLRERGLDAEVRPVREVKDLERYTVVLGSAVYLGAWLKEARAFLDRNEGSLRRMPLWLFSSGPTADDPMDLAVSVKTRRARRPRPPRPPSVPAALGPKRLNLLERGAIKAAKSPIGDFRDWSDIERWADSIADS